MSFDLNTNVTEKSGLTAEQLLNAEKALSPGNGYNEGFFDALVAGENEYGINALFALAHADIESAHGTSYYAKTRNNLYGFNAVDSDPNEASNYPSQAVSVSSYEQFLKEFYLTPGAAYYNGDTIHDIFVKYSSSHDVEGNSVAGVMNDLQSHIDGTAEPAAPAAPPAPTSTATYHVNSGDVLSVIIEKYPGTTVEDFVNANKAKYPQITPDFIEAGWDLVIPGSHNPEASPAPSAPAEERITVPPAPEGDLSNLAAKYGSTVAEIVEWNKAAYPQVSPDFVEAGWTNFRVK